MRPVRNNCPVQAPGMYGSNEAYAFWNAFFKLPICRSGILLKFELTRKQWFFHNGIGVRGILECDSIPDLSVVSP